MSDRQIQMSEAVLQALVSVAKAHGTRAAARKDAVRAKAEKEEADRDVRQFGMYNDCGPSYEAAAAAADGAFRSAVMGEISAEKAYKKARLDAIEAQPEVAPLIEKYVHGKS